MPGEISIRWPGGAWRYGRGGAVPARTRTALDPREGDMPPVVHYFPREDVAMVMPNRSSKVTHCPNKGDAGCFAIVSRSGRLESAP